MAGCPVGTVAGAAARHGRSVAQAGQDTDTVTW